MIQTQDGSENQLSGTLDQYIFILFVYAVFNQTCDFFDRVHMAAFGHGIDVRLSVLIQLTNGVKECAFCDFFFLKYHAESLTFEGTGVENLVSAAGICGKRNQEIWFL